MRLAVVADPHCDDFGAKVDAASGLNARWVDSVSMLRWVARDALARGAEALIVAGDLTESRHPAPWRVAQIGEAIAAFAGPVTLVRGNHDGLRADRSIVDALAGARDLWAGFSRPGFDQRGDTTIVALPYMDRHQLRSMPGFETVPEADLFKVLGDAFLTIARGLYAQATRERARGGPIVLVVHQGLSGGLMSDQQAAFLGDHSLVVDTGVLGAIGFDAIVAGHFHKHQVLSTSPLIAYAGAPTRTDFGEEHQAKGYLIVDVERGSAAMQFVETPARRYVTITDAATISDALGIEGAIVRARFTDPDVDVDDVRRFLEERGAFEVTTVEAGRRAAPEIAGGLSESLSANEALAAYFREDADRDALVERGRRVLAEVAS